MCGCIGEEVVCGGVLVRRWYVVCIGEGYVWVYW